MIKLNSPAVKPTPIVSVLLSGSGGQGLIFAGRLLAEAVALYDGLDVIQTNSYGPEARGGASKSQVVLGLGEIDVLHAKKVDVLVCLNQPSCDAYFKDLKPDGLLITDSDAVRQVPTTRGIEVPLSSMARKEVGGLVVVNVMALAVLSAASKLVTKESLLAAINGRIPPAHREKNRKAVEVGFAAAAQALSLKSPKELALLPDFSRLRSSVTTATTAG
jgi:2-oxoglutarate ferredoxin oxidoreductase subunit gamma